MKLYLKVYVNTIAAAQDVLKSSKEVKLHGPVSNFTDEFSHRLKQLYDLVEKQDIGEVDFENISAEIIQIKSVSTIYNYFSCLSVLDLYN